MTSAHQSPFEDAILYIPVYNIFMHIINININILYGYYILILHMLMCVCFLHRIYKPCRCILIVVDKLDFTNTFSLLPSSHEMMWATVKKR